MASVSLGHQSNHLNNLKKINYDINRMVNRKNGY
jgi:hypothetical protein